MKNFTFLFLLMSLTLSTQAQITINQVDFTLDITGDTLNLATCDAAGLSEPQGGTDMIWDYTNLSILSTEGISYEPASSSDFPNSNVRSTTSYNLLGYPVTLPTYRYMTFDAQGLSYDGYDQHYVPVPIGTITGNTADTLFNLAGPALYSNSWSFIDFPLNYNDSSTVLSTSEHHVLVDAAPYGLDDYPITQKHFTTTTKHVKGWGKLILTNPDTQLPDTIEVLLQERTTSTIDSFYTTGGLVPNSLLGVMGVAQGSSGGTTTFQYFYTKGLNQYAMIFVTSNGLAPSLYYNTDVFRDGMHVPTKAKKSAVVTHTVFPNPVKNHQFQLELEKNNGEKWQLRVANILGQTVHQASVINNRSTVQLDTNLNSGQYFYTVKNEEGQIVANGKLVL